MVAVIVDAVVVVVVFVDSPIVSAKVATEVTAAPLPFSSEMETLEDSVEGDGSSAGVMALSSDGKRRQSSGSVVDGTSAGGGLIDVVIASFCSRGSFNGQDGDLVETMQIR